MVAIFAVRAKGISFSNIEYPPSSSYIPHMGIKVSFEEFQKGCHGMLPFWISERNQLNNSKYM